MQGAAIRRGGDVWCWTRSDNDNPGAGPAAARDPGKPTRVDGVKDVTAVATGLSTACALQRDGAVICGGSNRQGQCGRGKVSEVEVPGPVVNLPLARAISGGNSHMCAIARDGSAWCWGDNDRGQIGDERTCPRDKCRGGQDAYPAPRRLPVTSPVRRLFVQASHTCLTTDDRQVSCAGMRPVDSTSGGKLVVAKLPDIAPFIDVNPYSFYVLSADGRLMAWWSEYGELDCDNMVE